MRPIKLGKGFKPNTPCDPVDTARDASAKIAMRKRKQSRRRVVRPSTVEK